jgi:hypothetical protein
LSKQILFFKLFFVSTDDVEIVDVSSRMRLSGRMAIRAFLHPRATVAEAKEAVKVCVNSLTNTFFNLTFKVKFKVLF